MILNELKELLTVRKYIVNIEYKDFMLSYYVTITNGIVDEIKSNHYNILKNSEKKIIKQFINNIFI